MRERTIGLCVKILCAAILSSVGEHRKHLDTFENAHAAQVLGSEQPTFYEASGIKE